MALARCFHGRLQTQGSPGFKRSQTGRVLCETCPFPNTGVLASCVCHTRVPQIERLKQQTFIVSVLKIRNPSPQCWWGWFFLRAVRENPSSLWCLQAIFGIPWLVWASPQSLPSSSHGVLPVCMLVSVSGFPLSLRTQSYWIKAYPSDFILTRSFAKTSFQRRSHSHTRS